MSETEDIPPVIAVDWEAVESEGGDKFESDLRRIMVHEGTTPSLTIENHRQNETFGGQR